MDEYKQALEHDRQQIVALLTFPATQFIPGDDETPEERYLRRLEDCGAGPKGLAKSWEEMKHRYPWLANL
jgi:hypothetical protein